MKLVEKIVKIVMHRNFVANGGSASYWERRYAKNGNSGAGSYGRLAEFKADVINSFLEDNPEIKECIEWGCGDGNQLSLIKYDKYVGVDVSQCIIDSNIKNNTSNSRKFYVRSEFVQNIDFVNKYDMSLSLDVIYHLIEDEVYKKYMNDLFDSSKKYVCIYSTNYDKKYEGYHIKHRNFTSWIADNRKEWKLLNVVKQKYPAGVEGDTSDCDFYFYIKTMV